MSERALGSLGIAPVGEEQVERRDQYGSSRPLAGSRRSREAVMLTGVRLVFVRTERPRIDRVLPYHSHLDNRLACRAIEPERKLAGR